MKDSPVEPVIIHSLDQFRQGTCRMPGDTQNKIACAVGKCVVEGSDVFKMSVTGIVNQYYYGLL